MIRPDTSVFWDYNGTLVNDTPLCLSLLNRQLTEHGLPTLTHDEYCRRFTFPLEQFYRAAGFDLSTHPFTAISNTFLRRYNERRYACPLHTGAREALDFFFRQGNHQYILSAYETSLVKEMVSYYGLDNYFTEIIGADDTHAAGKVAEGRRFFTHASVDPKTAVLIGDTTYDAKVARVLGMQSILVAQGHHNSEQLRSCGVPVFASLTDLLRSRELSKV